MEQSRGFSTWMRFGDISLLYLLERVEACYRDEGLLRWSKGWEEGGRRFKLECQENEVERFIFCFVAMTK